MSRTLTSKAKSDDLRHDLSRTAAVSVREWGKEEVSPPAGKGTKAGKHAGIFSPPFSHLTPFLLSSAYELVF